MEKPTVEVDDSEQAPSEPPTADELGAAAELYQLQFQPVHPVPKEVSPEDADYVEDESKSDSDSDSAWLPDEEIDDQALFKKPSKRSREYLARQAKKTKTAEVSDRERKSKRCRPSRLNKACSLSGESSAATPITNPLSRKVQPNLKWKWGKAFVPGDERKIFVHGVAYGVTPDYLEAFFGTYGTVESIKILCVLRKTTLACVVFKTEQEAQNALKDNYTIQGVPVVVHSAMEGCAEKCRRAVLRR